MKKIIFLLGVLGVQAFAINISFMDRQMVFDSHPDTKKAKEVLQKEIEEKNLEIKIREKEIMNLEEELRKPISEEVKRRKEATIQIKISDFQKYQEEAAKEIAKKKEELEEKINMKIEKVIKEIAKNKKIDIILDKDVVVYGVDGLDITDEVIKKIKEVESKK